MAESRNLSKHQRIVIDLAVAVLRDAMDRSNREKVDTLAVRLALRCLLPHCPERWPLTMFWEAAGVDHDIGRGQSITASFNGITRQLSLAGVRLE